MESIKGGGRCLGGWRIVTNPFRGGLETILLSEGETRRGRKKNYNAKATKKRESTPTIFLDEETQGTRGNREIKKKKKEKEYPIVIGAA